MYDVLHSYSTFIKYQSDHFHIKYCVLLNMLVSMHVRLTVMEFTETSQFVSLILWHEPFEFCYTLWTQ